MALTLIAPSCETRRIFIQGSIGDVSLLSGPLGLVLVSGAQGAAVVDLQAGAVVRALPFEFGPRFGDEVTVSGDKRWGYLMNRQSRGGDRTYWAWNLETGTVIPDIFTYSTSSTAAPVIQATPRPRSDQLLVSVARELWIVSPDEPEPVQYVPWRLVSESTSYALHGDAFPGDKEQRFVFSDDGNWMVVEREGNVYFQPADIDPFAGTQGQPPQAAGILLGPGPWLGSSITPLGEGTHVVGLDDADRNETALILVDVNNGTARTLGTDVASVRVVGDEVFWLSDAAVRGSLDGRPSLWEPRNLLRYQHGTEEPVSIATSVSEFLPLQLVPGQSGRRVAYRVQTLVAHPMEGIWVTD